MTLRVRTVTMSVIILNLFSKPLCVSICCVVTLHLPGVARVKSSLRRNQRIGRMVCLIKRTLIARGTMTIAMRRKARVMKLAMQMTPVTPLTRL